MNVTDEHGRPEPESHADEPTTLVGFLDYQRATFEWKCSGLDGAALRVTIAASSMTLGGMIKHLALVEEWWFNEGLLGHGPVAPWDGVDWEADPDGDWNSAAKDSPETLWDLWHENVERSRAQVNQALTYGDLSQLAERTGPDGRSPSLRWILCHMIEEYARHNGHADLLRESIDGQTGE